MARTLATRLQEAGRIRIGDQVETNGRKRPRKLDKFRLTSTNPAALNLAAAMYGGEVREWRDAPGKERQWELYTEINSMDVVLILQKGCDVSYEQWQGGFCTRRCDGNFISKSPYDLPLVGQECQCDDVPDAPCKLVIRLALMLPDVTGLGTWRVESHGYYTASALKSTMDTLQAAMPGHALVEAVMTLTTETRKSIVDGKPTTYHFPVIGLQPKFTPRQLAAGIPNQALMLAKEQQKSTKEHVGDIWGDTEGTIIDSPQTSSEVIDGELLTDESTKDTDEEDEAVIQSDKPTWRTEANATAAVLREAEIAGSLSGQGNLAVLTDLEALLRDPDKFTPAQRTIRLAKAEKLRSEVLPF